eukprot:CAMPEP_0176475864 /NCGR_PEP_ID=MMETSP0127-20121128/43835_1 /TAXON_ID=938130 /ORGANISM="Platyophrya macrostoma, Strain WH" /LENGTH=619 /DNA_ID=CAMNT_0017871491 /DNA_START=108 /DNA_END=1967 /DNA_ORIENTATION=+
MIKDGKYTEAIQVLKHELQFAPRSRASSLLGYCYFQNQDYSNAARVYEQLVRNYPEVDDYKLYYAQSLHKEGLYDEALKACQSLDNPAYQQKLLLLQTCIKYEQEELQFAKSLIQQASDDPDMIINEGCVLFKENKFDEARKKFEDAMNTVGNSCELSYNIALCHYKLKQLAHALKHIADIIEKGVKEHPEFGIGSNAEGIEVRSVGNTQALRETALIEAFNLKAAIEYSIKNIAAAKDALIDMPPRSEDELDPVTLMNKALINMEDDPTGGFKKLNFLLQNPPFPPETFQNLLLLYCKYQYFDLAADVLAENADLTYKCITPEDFEFIDALILQQASPEQAYKKFESLGNKHIDNLRKLTKQINDARNARDNEALKKALKEFDDALEKYIPVLMSQARIYWNSENYGMVEKLFRQSAEYCADHETWRLNVAHVLYMQENKYRESIRYYEPIVKRYSENLLSLTAIVIANLCVSYIMVGQNEDAEELMRKLEREEEKESYQDPEKPLFHLCIVNLVIGTLYCSKGNYEFGISRIIKSLEPYNKKINTDTWFYAKRCFCALMEILAKQMIILKDASYYEMLTFLDAADQFGKEITTTIGPLENDNKNTVSDEARMNDIET